MFPLTPIPPQTKAGWLLCFYDKVAAVSDYLSENKWKLRNAAEITEKTKKLRLTFLNQLSNNTAVK